MKRILSLLLMVFTCMLSFISCASDTIANSTTVSNSENLAPITMEYGCYNPAFSYYVSSYETLNFSSASTEDAPEEICNEVYSICDDVCTYVNQKYGINISTSKRVPVYICNLDEFLGGNGIFGVYDDVTDAIYLDPWILTVDRSKYYRLLAHECCHLLQAHMAPSSVGAERWLEKDDRVLGFGLCEGICENLAVAVTAWKSTNYSSEIAGYVDETFLARMLEISIPKLVEYYFTFNVLDFSNEVNLLICKNTTYKLDNSATITPFEHLLCHADMCNIYRNYAYIGDAQKGALYVYSAKAIIEMSCAMARNLQNNKKQELWSIIEEYDKSSFKNSMLRDYSELFESALY